MSDEKLKRTQRKWFWVVHIEAALAIVVLIAALSFLVWIDGSFFQ